MSLHLTRKPPKHRIAITVIGGLSWHISGASYIFFLLERWCYPCSFFSYTRYVICLSCNFSDVIMSTMASQITSLTIVYSTAYSGPGERKHKSSVSLAFVRGIHRGLVNSPHKARVTRKLFPFDEVIMQHWYYLCSLLYYIELPYIWVYFLQQRSVFIQITKTLDPTSIRHWSDAFLSDRCLIDADARVYVFLVVFLSVYAYLCVCVVYWTRGESKDFESILYGVGVTYT